MTSKILFGSSNYGSEIGINYGSVKNEFHHSLDFDKIIPIVSGAMFDSYADQHKDKCLSGTRTDIINQIKEWASVESSPHGKCIFWLNGIAGTGKSTISRTMADFFSQNGSLGASFFFERGEGDRGNARKLFPTIARQLAINIPQMMPALQAIARADPSIAAKAMREQFKTLLLQPLQRLERPVLSAQALSIQTMVIVIDALDECEGDNDIRLILQLLPELQNLAALRLRVLLTSRPDLPVRLGFSKIASEDHRDLILHDIPEEVIAHDITLFLNHRLTEVRTERSLPTDWPCDGDFQKLVALSVPLFIFAATICRLFEDPVWDPTDSLADILTHQNDESKLDSTYLPVLDRLLYGQHGKRREILVTEFQQIIGVIVTLESPLSVISLAKLLGFSKDLIQLRLNPLHSVLRVPDDETIPDAFLLLRKHLLHWIEAMSLMGLTSEILDLLDHFKTAIPLPQVREGWDTELQILEGHLAEVCSVVFSPDGRLLASGSPDGTVRLWNPNTGALVQILEDKSTKVLSVAFSPNCLRLASGSTDGIVSLWDLSTGAPPQYLEGHSDEVWSVAFSPDSRLLASGSNDMSLYLWDVATGAIAQMFEGHLGTIHSVAFSLDGRLLASGSFDSIVRLWDLATGTLKQNLEGHSGEVRSVVFSPDGRLLASGSSDGTVRVWDPVAGVLTQCLEDCSDVASLAFSPNSQILASSSLYQVQLWDLATGIDTQTLMGHSDVPISVAFSPISQLLATGSLDRTVRLWDLEKDAFPYNVGGDRIWSVAFSPNGRLLASGSAKGSVHLWNPTIGTIMQSLKGHSDVVRSVAFSPDGRLLASGSHDETVCLWDLATGTLTQILRSHSDAVLSVTFSPDSQMMASGSQDGTVRLWDLATGLVTGTLQRHSNAVWSVKFSPDGGLLASSSYHDHIVCTWDTMTGLLMQTWELDEGDVMLGFSQDGSCIRTNLGAINIQSRWEISETHSPCVYPKISIEYEQWIQLNGENILWLPVEFRPKFSKFSVDLQINGNMIALGLISGRVCFLEICA
ncbi:hypothetical protein N7504_001777 [Penicillium tannophilum]|nr:hypothetical protein N7504_001777 [Penicillium tannophilum]